MVSLVVAAGVVDQTHEGSSALELAVLLDQWEMVGILSKEGSQLTNARAVEAIRLDDAGTLSEVLNGGLSAKDSGPDGYGLLTHAIIASAPSAAEALMNAGADVEETSEDGTFPLLLAVISNTPDMVELLLSTGGANPNRRFEDASLLEISLISGGATTKLLLDAGADPSGGNTDGPFPGDLAGSSWARRPRHPACPLRSHLARRRNKTG